MTGLVTLLGGTILLRPYVFFFLLVYLVAGSLTIGRRTTLLFVPAGYLIAFLSEKLSITTGFPYGWYSYIETTRERELWVCGVPFFDSLSYVFLAWCSYLSAVVLRAPRVVLKGEIHVLDDPGIRTSLATRLLGALLMTILDLVIDPVALRGGEWFLGSIYSYRTPGIHFGVPLSNYLGWFLTGYVMVTVLSLLDRNRPLYCTDTVRFGWLSPVALYAGIILFNLSIACFIAAWGPLLSGVIIGGGTFGVMALTLRRTWSVRACVSAEGGCQFQ